MAKLIYSSITSLDGYIEDQDGNFEWAAPDDQVSSFLNDLERDVGTYLNGRRMYETMVYWEQDPVVAGEPDCVRECRELWRAADKIVFSKSLDTVSATRTRLEREFDPSAIKSLKDSLVRDITVAGPDLATQALRAGLVDECQLFLTPTLVGSGKASMPSDIRLDLELLDEHRFQSGVAYLRYRIPN
jgi:dihydrofolate reductase